MARKKSELHEKPKAPATGVGPEGACAHPEPENVPSLRSEDRSFIGEAMVPMVERDGPRLLELARRCFQDLSRSEERFFRNLGIVHFGTVQPDTADAAKALRADRLAWTLLDSCALRLLTPLGILVWGANIRGELNLNHCRAELSIRLDYCRFDDAVLLQDSRLGVLSLQYSHLRVFNADRMRTCGDVFLRNGSRFEGEVRLVGAEIGCSLACAGSTFSNKDGLALVADGINVQGAVFLGDKATYRGEVRFPGAKIGGDFTCTGSSFHNPGGIALNASGLHVAGNMLLNNYAVFMGEAKLQGAVIGGSLDCSGGIFSNPEARALCADMLKVAGSAFLGYPASFTGEVLLRGAEISGSLVCSGGVFGNPGKKALSADRIKITGSASLGNQAVFIGEVRFLGATVGGNFQCDGGTFSNPGGRALSAERLNVLGSVIMRKRVVKHRTAPPTVISTAITGVASFVNAVIDGHFITLGLARTAYSLWLTHARVGVLWDDQKSWPEDGKLKLDGFNYGRLDEEAEWELAPRLDWLSRHGSPGMFNPQPYEQLANMYREAGYEFEARDVLITKHWRWLTYNLRKPVEPSGPEKKPADSLPKPRSARSSLAGCLLAGLFGLVCGFGYKPWRAAVAWLGLWIVAMAAAWWMHAAKWLVPTDPVAEGIGIVAPGYAFDLLTPILSLGYVSKWLPAHAWAAAVLMVLSSLGYVLVALFAASITGLVRK